MYKTWHVEDAYHALKTLISLQFTHSNLSINYAYKTIIHKEMFATDYAHFYHLVGYLERKGLVTTKKVGRIREIKITEKGRELYNLLEKVNEFDLGGDLYVKPQKQI